MALKFYEDNPDFVLPKTRMNEVKSFVKGGLRDLSVSRTSFKWGVPVPDAPDHIMYVWIDALTNYMTAAGYPDVDSEKYKTFWPNVKHMVGKDILRHHAVYWPAFLMAAKLDTPKRVFAHGWWTSEGQKISKSLGNVIDPFQIVDEFGLDAVRYFLMREVPFGNDGDFSRKAMVSRINADLANDFGNLAQRCLSMIAKNCDGKVPDFDIQDETSNIKEFDIISLGSRTLDDMRRWLETEAIQEAIISLIQSIKHMNAYFANSEPWALKKTDPEKMNQVLYATAEGIRQAAILAQPIMPDAMDKMLDQLAVAESERTFAHISSDFALKSGTILPAPEGVFPRFVEAE